MEESKILKMTVNIPEEWVGKDIRLMTKDDTWREAFVNKMRVDGGREVKPKKFVKFKKAGDHLLEFEISRGRITKNLFFCESEEKLCVTKLHIPESVKVIEEYGFCNFIFKCLFVVPDSVTYFGGSILGCEAGKEYNWENFTVFSLGLIPENDQTREEIILREGVMKVMGALTFNTRHLHIPSTCVVESHSSVAGDLFDRADKVTVADGNPVLRVESDCMIQNQLDYKGAVDCVQLIKIGPDMDALPSGITSIRGFKLLKFADKLPAGLDVERLILPDGLTDYSGLPLDKMTRLKEIVQNDNVVWKNSKMTDAESTQDCKDGLTLSEDGKTVLKCNGTQISVVIPKGVKVIAKEAFKGNATLQQITLPDTLKTIEESAFEGCSALAEVIGGAKVSKIADRAFRQSGLKKIALPDTLKDIKKKVFEECASLSDVTLGNSVKRIWEYAFDGCPIKTVMLPDTVEQIDRRALGGALIEEIKLPASLKKANFAFHDTKLKHGIVPEGVEIDYSHCRELESITIPENITRIPDYLLSGCAKITDIHIPAGVTEIGECAYRETSIKSISLPEGLKIIGTSAFAFSDIEEVVLPDSVVNVGWRAFNNCKSLKRVVFGKNISNIGDEAFSECEALEEVVIPDGRSFTIQPAAFSRCKNLKRVITPEGTDSQFKEKILKTVQLMVVIS